MSWIYTVILVLLSIFTGGEILIRLAIMCFIGWLLCDIDVAKEYTWYSGIWQGIFFVPNYCRHLIFDTPFKAEYYTMSYNVCYWIAAIISSLGYLFPATNK